MAVPEVTAFISYSHADRKWGAQAKAVLADAGIESFLAHEDLRVSEEWQERILEELCICDIFVPLLSSNFLSSEWASQEVGHIISRPDVAIAPLSIDGTKPFGFLSRLQSQRIPADGITADLLVTPLAHRFPRKILPGMIRSVRRARSLRSAETTMRPLVQFFPIFTPEEVRTLAQAAVENDRIWVAALCRSEYLPEFIRTQGPYIWPKTMRALKYQLKNGRWYTGEALRPRGLRRSDVRGDGQLAPEWHEGIAKEDGS